MFYRIAYKHLFNKMLIEKENKTMGKVETNNEIIRMRRLVRQARVCVIHKLTREVKTLRAKSGTEKQQEKNKRKADKLVSEIHALKKIKDDRITKFGIANKKSLQEILQTKNGRENTRIMARVADYKSLKNAIIKFREKYPDYEQYLKLGKKKSSKQKVKSQEKQNNNTEIKREAQLGSIKSESKTIEYDLTSESSSEQCADPSNDDNDNKHSDMENDVIQHNSEPGSLLRIKPPTYVETENKRNKRLKRNEEQSIESMKGHNDVYNNEDSTDVNKTRETFEEDKEQKTVKVISEQATVKRFTELLHEQDSEKGDSWKNKDKSASDKNKPESEKQVDSFFMSGDGDAYLSVAQPVVVENKDLLENEDNYDNKSKRYTNKKKFTNDRFFNNVRSIDTERRQGKQKGSWQNDNGFTENRSSFKNQRNTNISSFNNVSKKRSNDARANSNESGDLHPSWVAKKKQQEIVKQGFQGKKIIFDDD